MRRLAHNEDWGYAPVLSTKGLYPAKFPASLRYLPSDGAYSSCQHFLEINFCPAQLVVKTRSLFPPTAGKVRPIEPEGFKDCEIAIADFIGVAVQYGVMPRPFLSYGQGGKDIGGDDLVRSEAVMLYLMHEERQKDILLYFADHEDEILALWQFWSSRFSLPKLVVSADGYVHEEQEKEGALILRSSRGRAKSYALSGRRPVFYRVREVGREQFSRPLIGREIFARH